MAEDKATKALKDTNTNEKIELVFWTYDKYGRRTNKRIDVTELIGKEFDDLGWATRNFVGLQYHKKDQADTTLPAYRKEDGEDFKRNVGDMVTTAIVNSKQLGAMDRQMERFFYDFHRRLFDPFWLD